MLPADDHLIRPNSLRSHARGSQVREADLPSNLREWGVGASVPIPKFAQSCSTTDANFGIEGH
jgi:hypothetical protein